jgi:hypothetical protein
MAHHKKGGRLSRKVGSVIDQEPANPVGKSKAKKPKKQSRGKHK